MRAMRPPGQADAADERAARLSACPRARGPGEQPRRFGSRPPRSGDESERDHGRARAEARSRGMWFVKLNRLPSTGASARRPARRDARGRARRRRRSPRARSRGRARTGAVEAGAEVGGRGGGADVDRHADASAIASGWGSTVVGGGLRRAAVSVSFRPCPVMTQTTRAPGSGSSGRARRRPAADEGSQRPPRRARARARPRGSRRPQGHDLRPRRRRRRLCRVHRVRDPDRRGDRAAGRRPRRDEPGQPVPTRRSRGRRL